MSWEPQIGSVVRVTKFLDERPSYYDIAVGDVLTVTNLKYSLKFDGNAFVGDLEELYGFECDKIFFNIDNDINTSIQYIPISVERCDKLMKIL